jgi:4-amino-4-deoxy-L-arabinose transferase-like glycosyltransferase
LRESLRLQGNQPTSCTSNRVGVRLLALVLILFVLVGAIYSVATPIFEASDERWHYPVVKHIADGQGLPVQNADLPTLWHQEGSQPPLYYLVSAGFTQRIDTDDFAEIQRPNPHAIVGLPHVVGNKNMMIHTDRESWPWRGTTLAVHLTRLMSVGLGAITVWLTWHIARCLWPGGDQAASLAAMLTAFNPMFLFISASVNNDNLAAALAAGAVVVLLSALRRGQTVRDGLLLGVLLGLGALTKLSVLALVPVTAVALTYDAWRRRAWRTWLISGVLILGCMVLIAGWWYWRNWSLYGDLTGSNRMLDIAGRRDEALTLGGLWAEFEGFRISYWALFGGVSILADRWVYPILDALMLIGAIGVAAAGAAIIKSSNQQTSAPPQVAVSESANQRDSQAMRQRDNRTRKRSWFSFSHFLLSTSYSLFPAAYFVLIGWVGLTLILLIRWTSQTYASQGRLMFVAIAGISALVATGLVILTPRRWRWAMVGVTGGGLLLLAIVSPFRYIVPAYARPPLLLETDLPADAQRVDWNINGEMRLLGYELERPSIHPGETLPVTIYWQALAPMTEDYSVFVHVLGQDRAVVGQVNTYPGTGTWPTTLLKPGNVVADTYYVPIDPAARSPSLARVYAGLYRYDEPGRPGLPTVDVRGEPVEPWLATIKLTPWVWPDVTPSNPLQVRLGDAISLIGYDLDGGLTLYWQAQGQPAADYTVFIQLWDEDEQVAGFDGPPLGGDYPTSWWEAGEAIVDVHPLDLGRAGITLPLESGRHRFLVGLYRLDTGDRLPAVGPDGPLPDYAVELLGVPTGGEE